MSNAGVSFIGCVVIFFGYIASLWNSFLVMQTINATTFMWILWVCAIIFLILGTIIASIGKEM